MRMFIYLFTIVLLLGCTAPPVTPSAETEPDVIGVPESDVAKIPFDEIYPYEPSADIQLYSGGNFQSGMISVCKVINDQEMAILAGVPALSHSASFFWMRSTSRINTSNACNYESLESYPYRVRINYEASDQFGYRDLARTELVFGGYAYEYFNESDAIRVEIPDANTFIIFSIDGIPGTDEDMLVNIAKLFLSRIDAPAPANHTFILPAEETTTYTGDFIVFDYPSNWAATRKYKVGGDKVFLEDSNGILLATISTGSGPVTINESTYQKILAQYEYRNETILYQSFDGVSFTIFSQINGYKSTGYVSILKSGSLPGYNASLNVQGYIQQERYELYSDALIATLNSIRPA